MDKLESWEVYELFDSLKLADASQWEQTRWLMYVVAQVNSKKQLKLQDILKFPWEEGKIASSQSISDDDIKRLKAKAKQIGKELFNKK